MSTRIYLLNLKLFVIFILLFLSRSALAASAGIGVSLNNGHSYFNSNIIVPTILIPIEVTQHLLIEPFLNTSTSKSNTERFGSQEYTIDTFGLGIFFTHSLRDSVSHYYGAKLAYSMIGISYDGDTDEGDYWTIIPMAGFKYDATNTISAAFELGISYGEGDFTDCCDSTFNEEEENYALYAGLTMRYLFK